MADTVADLNFIAQSSIRSAVIMQAYGTPSVRTGDYEAKKVSIVDGRLVSTTLDLDRNGFSLIKSSTKAIDFFDPDVVQAEYYPDVTSVIQKHLGAKYVHIIDHTVRASEVTPGVRLTSQLVHNDYTETSCMEILGELTGSRIKTSETRVVQINLWRPVMNTVYMAPLAIADGSTVSHDDLVPCDIVYPDRVGEIYDVRYNADQQWYYFPEMETSEVLLIKGYDSMQDGRARLAPHTAFTHPETNSANPPRTSIEVRTILTF